MQTSISYVFRVFHLLIMLVVESFLSPATVGSEARSFPIMLCPPMRSRVRFGAASPSSSFQTSCGTIRERPWVCPGSGRLARTANENLQSFSGGVRTLYRSLDVRTPVPSPLTESSSFPPMSFMCTSCKTKAFLLLMRKE
uniref:Putative secreted protein n=1 Tax=Ixodes ricinus TaxID=34613 RepID=A0A6B0UUH9_IXORI